MLCGRTNQPNIIPTVVQTLINSEAKLASNLIQAHPSESIVYRRPSPAPATLIDKFLEDILGPMYSSEGVFLSAYMYHHSSRPPHPQRLVYRLASSRSHTSPLYPSPSGLLVYIRAESCLLD